MFLFSPSLYLPFFLSTLHSRFLSSYFPSSFLFVFLPSYDFNTQFREFFFSPIPSVSLFSYLLSTTIAFNPIFLFYPSSIFLPSYDLCTSNSIFFSPSLSPFTPIQFPAPLPSILLSSSSLIYSSCYLNTFNSSVVPLFTFLPFIASLLYFLLPTTYTSSIPVFYLSSSHLFSILCISSFLRLNHLQFQYSPSFSLSSSHLSSIFLPSYGLNIVNSIIPSFFLCSCHRLFSIFPPSYDLNTCNTVSFSFHGATIPVTALILPPFWKVVDAAAEDSWSMYSGRDCLLMKALARSLNFTFHLDKSSNIDEVRCVGATLACYLRVTNLLRYAIYTLYFDLQQEKLY